MDSQESKEQEFIIPTKYKSKIGSYLSWPTGAEKISTAFAETPQASALELTFSEHWPKYHQGKWPVCCSIFEAAYLRIRHMNRSNEPSWSISIRPVLREHRAKIKEALESNGFTTVKEWLNKNGGLTGREGSVRFEILWDSELGELKYFTRSSADPVVTTDAWPKKDNML